MNEPSERLGAMDTAYLYAEHPGYPIHVGSVATFEAGPLLDAHGQLRLGDLQRLVESRLERLPRLRRKLSWTPLGINRPCWIDAVDFDVADHVDAVMAPPPGDDEALRRVAAATWSELLDRSHPLWHIRFVTGLEGGRVGLIERVHHALVDGVSGVDVAAVLLDIERETTTSSPAPFEPARPDPAAVVALRAARQRALDLGAVAATAGATMLHPTRLAAAARSARDVAVGLLDDGVAPPSSLNVATGRRRRFAWVRGDLAAVKAAGAGFGATANDVLLAAVTAGLRHALLARGEAVAHDAVLRALVPVSVRRPDERGALGNRVSGLVVPLPIGLGDPAERLRTIAATTARLKAGHGADAAETLLGIADLLPPVAIRLLAPLVQRQPFFNLVVTNVPGPGFPLYMHGARMLEAFPIVPLVGNQSVGVAVLSYDGALNIGLTADAAACPDLDVVVDGIEHGLREVGAEPLVPV